MVFDEIITLEINILLCILKPQEFLSFIQNNHFGATYSYVGANMNTKRVMVAYFPKYIMI
jgi:hypothetical protein